MKSWADDGSILGVDCSVSICIYIGYSVLVLSRPWCTAAWITCTSRYPWWTRRSVTLKVGALYRWLEPCMLTLIAWFMGPTWGPSGADRTQVGPMLAPWTLLSGYITQSRYNTVCSLPNTHNPLSRDIFALLALCEENLYRAGEFPSQRASKAGFGKTVEMLVIWAAITLMWRHCNETPHSLLRMMSEIRGMFCNSTYYISFTLLWFMQYRVILHHRILRLDRIIVTENFLSIHLPRRMW